MPDLHIGKQLILVNSDLPGVMYGSSIMLKITIFNNCIISQLWEQIFKHFQIVFSCNSCGSSLIIMEKMEPMVPLLEIAHDTASLGKSRLFCRIALEFSAPNVQMSNVLKDG